MSLFHRELHDSDVLRQSSHQIGAVFQVYVQLPELVQEPKPLRHKQQIQAKRPADDEEPSGQ